MTALRITLAIPVALLTMVAAVVSLPWLMLGMGVSMLGDEELGDKIIFCSPIEYTYRRLWRD